MFACFFCALICFYLDEFTVKLKTQQPDENTVDQTSYVKSVLIVLFVYFSAKNTFKLNNIQNDEEV